MIKKTLLFAFILTMVLGVNAQTKKEQRQAKRTEAFVKTDSLIATKSYRFDATKANPTGGQQVDLATHTAELDIVNDSVFSYLPFFGRAYNASYGGADGGMKFETLIRDYEVKIDTSKQTIAISFSAKDSKDTYNCNISVTYGGTATLSITSNNRATISYYGNVIQLKKK